MFRNTLAQSSGAVQLVRTSIETIDPPLLQRWRALALERGNPFATPEWYGAWIDQEAGEEPFLLFWWQQEQVAGVLPLVRARRGSVHVLRSAGGRFADWFSPVCAVEDEAACAAAFAGELARVRSRWSLLELERVEDGGFWPQAFWGVEGGRFAPARPTEVAVLPFIELGEGGFAEYLAGRSRNFRSQLGRRRRKLERERELRFRMTAEPAELERDLQTFFDLHQERWRDRGGSAALSERTMSAHRRFAAAALERGWLRLWIAEVDGEPGAAWYGWRVGSRYCYALSGMRKSLQPFGLGTVLLAHTIEAAAAEGAEVYDLLRGDESYKQRFETGRRQAQSWTLGRRLHPIALGHALGNRLVTGARGLPTGLREPARRVYRRVVR